MKIQKLRPEEDPEKWPKTHDQGIYVKTKEMQLFQESISRNARSRNLSQDKRNATIPFYYFEYYFFRILNTKNF